MQCEYIKPSGDQCRRTAGDSRGLCYAHDPARAAERAESAAKGGRARANQGAPSGVAASISEVQDIQDELQEVTAGVLAGEIGSRPGQVAIAGLNARLRAAAEHYRLTEEVEFERRLAEVEERTK